ncbi:MAG TPA: hypothetical protein VEI03_16770 [Stellaceae bacterium]|nr:hypothetical protein [Stellaceae bacterium]
MKTFAMCMQCQIDLGRPSLEPFIADYFDDGIARIECSAGHKTALMMQSQKFEMLLDSGATALLEGFTLEACASFAAALERLYEFGLRVAFVGRNMQDDLFDGMFSEMARQSERQLGAFLLLHALELGSAYKPKLSIATFRNAVIHKGAIPTVEEACKFCSEVYEAIYSVFGTIRAKYGDSIQTVVMKELSKRRAKLPGDMRVSTSAGFNLFSIAREANASSFSDALASFKEGRERLNAAIPAMMALHKALQQRQAEP